MKLIIFVVLFLAFSGCSKPKTVLICGDHVCINKTEANQYFEDNLTLEVKIINKNKLDKIDLVELNMKKTSTGEKSISISSKKKTTNDIKILSNKDSNYGSMSESAFYFC